MLCPLLRPLIIALILAGVLAGPVARAESPTPSGDLSYLPELIETARGAKLWDDRYWHILLHYHRGLFGTVRSEQDDPRFFRSPVGKTNPQAELEATLASFFSEELVGRSKQPARCAFVARYEWLRAQLKFDESRMPPRQCERFDRWLAEMNAQSVSLIFPSAFMNNPSSMFGHTLLRVDQHGQTEQTRILAYTINYAADVAENEGPLYPIKGIYGFYKGYFSTIPYYLKVKEYRDLENRDIWEYRLNFTEHQVRRMLTHAWELGNASFDYYFFKENCSYHILSLLEVADPSLRLQDKFVLWTVPADTLRLLSRQDGTVTDITYRPSRSTQIRQRRAALTPEERALLGRLVSDATVTQSKEFAALAPERQALVLDIASDILLYRSNKDADREAAYRDRNVAILGVRSKLKALAPLIPIVPIAESPEQGHGTHRAAASFGWRNDELFEEVQLRAAYHDLLDPDTGYLKDAQIELLAASIRHYERQDQYRLERVNLVNIISLSPMDSVFHSPSWKLRSGLESQRNRRSDDRCRYCSTGVLNGGVGGAVQAPLLRHAVGFAFAEVESNVGAGLSHYHRIGAGGTVGALADLTDRWKVLASMTYLRFPIGDQSEDWRVSFGQRYTLMQNLALRMDFNHRLNDNEALLTILAYF
ncbi:MAG TPA: DUF4105 domain-containing protein [Nitrospirales bacterium]|nr:DUF4105 domain-containing protein [Nitrospirales bacterium]